MANNGEIQNVAIVGTGVIGASWAAYHLSRGFDVIATDPAPNAEASLRKYVTKPGRPSARMAYLRALRASG